MDKRIKYEGSEMSQLLQRIRTIGYNKDIDIEYGTVTAPPPAIEVRLDSDEIPLDAGDLIIAEHLAEHTRQAVINGTPTTITFKNGLKTGDRVLIASMDDKQQYVIIDKAVTY